MKVFNMQAKRLNGTFPLIITILLSSMIFRMFFSWTRPFIHFRNLSLWLHCILNYWTGIFIAKQGKAKLVFNSKSSIKEQGKRKRSSWKLAAGDSVNCIFIFPILAPALHLIESVFYLFFSLKYMYALL